MPTVDGMNGPRATIRCRYCHREIIGCLGKHGDWMHVRPNREACTPGGSTFAEPRFLAITARNDLDVGLTRDRLSAEAEAEVYG